jgi:hypothetical protein
VPWSKRTTFQDIAKQYLNFIKKHYLLPTSKVKIVFDSYPQVPSTKDSTHLRRVKNACTNIRITDEAILDVTKAQFLSNSINKQRFVDYLVSVLDKIEGIECLQAEDDADTLIIETCVQ